MDPGEFTLLLERDRSGESGAHERLVALIHDDLKRLAHRHLAGNRWVATLNTTSVVNEAYLRLISPAARHVSTRLHFMNLASRVMRQIICDYARKRLLMLSNRGEMPEPDDSGIDVDAEYQQASQLAELDNALKKLTETKARHAEVVNCRFFAGYSEEETAEVLKISLRTVQRDWNEARAWLADHLRNV